MDSSKIDETDDLGLRHRKPTTSGSNGLLAEHVTDDKDKEEVTWGKTASGQGELQDTNWDLRQLKISVQGTGDPLVRTHYRNYTSPLFLDTTHFCFTPRSTDYILPTIKLPDYPVCVLPALFRLVARML
jgi:hypothetical protein